MQFIYPGFLYFLPVVLIPLIIHLFRFRRYRKVYFSNVRFIADLKLETERKSKLKHILVLIARMLALAMLVIAFAQPYRPVKQIDKALMPVRHVSIYVDNSFSMEAGSEEGILLESAKTKAAGIALAYDASDVFQLITNDLEGRHHRFLSREDFMNMLLDIEPSPVSLTLEDIIIRHRDLLRQDITQADLYVLSDFQYSLIPETSAWSDSGLFVFLVPIQPVAINNVYIDSVWFSTPVQLAGMQSTLMVRLRNGGISDLEKIPLKLTVKGEQRAVAALDIPAGNFLETSLVFRPGLHGWYHGELEIMDYPVTYDDKYFIAFNVREKIPVLSIFETRPGPFLNALFGNDSAIIFQQTAVTDLDYGAISTYDLIILNGLNSLSTGLINVLSDYLEQGGSLVIFPGPQLDLEDYNLFLSTLSIGKFQSLDTSNTRVSDIDRGHPLLKDVFDPSVCDREGVRVDLPEVSAHYPIDFPALNELHVLANLQNGRPFVLVSGLEQVNLMLFSVPLDPGFSSLPRHAIMVPLLYQMALSSRPVQRLSHQIGLDNMLLFSGLRSGDEVIRLRNLEGGPELLPEIRRRGADLSLFLHNQVRKAGVYQVFGSEHLLATTAFNYNRAESDLRYFSPEELESLCRAKGWTATRVLDAARQDTLKMVQDINKGVRFWKWFVIAAILLLAVEAILLRFMK